MISASIEFGSSMSGYAFSSKHEFNENPHKVHLKTYLGIPLISNKAPSCVLMSPDGKTMRYYGYDAEDFYGTKIEDGESESWYFFKNWMNTQYGCTGLGHSSMLADIKGKKLPTRTVLVEFIKRLKDECIEKINQIISGLMIDDIFWVFSVPVIWDEAAIQSLKEVAQLIGISGQNISIIRKPFATLQCLRYHNNEAIGLTKRFGAGTNLHVLNCGGNMVTFTVYEVMQNDEVKEVQNATLAGAGGNSIDEHFENFIDELFGKPVTKVLKNEYPDDYLGFIRDFQLKVRGLSLYTDSKINIRYPVVLSELVSKMTTFTMKEIIIKSKYRAEIVTVSDKWRISANLMRSLLAPTVERIVQFIKSRLEVPIKKDSATIILSGSFGGQPLLQETIRTTFPGKILVIPDETDTISLRGAVIYGHLQCSLSSGPQQKRLEKKKKPAVLMAAAIDFGTTYSGWACSFKSDFERDPIKVSGRTWNFGVGLSQKAPTCLLIKPDGKTVHSFGYEAESKYAELAADKCHQEWFFYKQFKMVLFGRIGLERNIMLEDASGKKLPAKVVFALAIKYLKEDLISKSKKKLLDGNISEEEIQWVLTVPAIWNDASKQFMREAAQNAGIPGDQLKIALEPEAASIFCRHLPVENHRGQNAVSLATFKEGTKYLVLDAGGGTIDITAHEIMSSGDMRELYRATGGAWGGTKVDNAFEEFLRSICGKTAMARFKEKHMEDYIGLFRNFEIKKRETHLDQDSNILIYIPHVLFELVKETTGDTLQESVMKSSYKDQVKIDRDKMKISIAIMKSFFQDSVTKILDHVENLLKESKLSGCSAVVMVGGYSEAPILQTSVEERFDSLKIIIPEEAGLVVMKGAVIYGHKPKTIAERVCKFTYGEETTHVSSIHCKHPRGNNQKLDSNGQMRCYDIFDKHATIGQAVSIGEGTKEHIYKPVNDDQTAIGIAIYASTSPTPYFVTDEGCTRIGGFSVPIVDTSLGRKRKFGVTYKFGGTEIEVTVTDKISGETTVRSVDFLE